MTARRSALALRRSKTAVFTSKRHDEREPRILASADETTALRERAREAGGFYREVRIPNLGRGLHLGGALGPDLPPARPRPAPHPLPPRRGPHPGRRDRPVARPSSL